MRGRTAAAGATDTNQLVALPDFYARHIAPELAAPDVNDRAIVKADALKFLTTFRGQARTGRGMHRAALGRAPGGLLSEHCAQGTAELFCREVWSIWCTNWDGGGKYPLFIVKSRMQLPKAACLEAFPHLVRLLGAEANVTHSYAAIAIDRMLTQKVRNNYPAQLEAAV